MAFTLFSSGKQESSQISGRGATAKVSYILTQPRFAGVLTLHTPSASVNGRTNLGQSHPTNAVIMTSACFLHFGPLWVSFFPLRLALCFDDISKKASCRAWLIRTPTRIHGRTVYLAKAAMDVFSSLIGQSVEQFFFSCPKDIDHYLCASLFSETLFHWVLLPALEQKHRISHMDRG